MHGICLVDYHGLPLYRIFLWLLFVPGRSFQYAMHIFSFATHFLAKPCLRCCQQNCQPHVRQTFARGVATYNQPNNMRHLNIAMKQVMSQLNQLDDVCVFLLLYFGHNLHFILVSLLENHCKTHFHANLEFLNDLKCSHGQYQSCSDRSSLYVCC